MEAGDLIIQSQPPRKKIVRKLTDEMLVLKKIETFYEFILTQYFKANIQPDTNLENFDTTNKITFDTSVEDYYQDEFINNVFNDWEDRGENSFDFYNNYKVCLSGEFHLDSFLKLWNNCSKWFKDEFDVDLLPKNARHCWNTICYWIIKTDEKETLFNLFKEKMDILYINWIDNKNRISRIPCGICYENKILYTGCSCCNNNYLCYICYESLVNKNTCPFCRCEEMIDDEPIQTAFAEEEIELKKEITDTINYYFSNPVVVDCSVCEKNIRYRDKLYNDDVKVYCGDCFNVK